MESPSVIAAQIPLEPRMALHLNTTPSTYVLFLDMQEVEGLDNAELVVNQSEKCPANPILPVGDLGAWDLRRASTWAGSVLYDEDEGTFKIWYHGEGPEGIDFLGIGYAWSKDGVLWHKPKLGLYEYRGSKQNNICFQSPTGNRWRGKLYRQSADHFLVTRDYRESDPSRRFKGLTRIYHEKEGRNAYFPIFSPDGIHWSVGPNPPAFQGFNDATNLIVDYEDPDPERRIKIFGADPNSPGHTGMIFGADLEHLTPSPYNPVVPEEIPDYTVHLFSALHYKGYYIALYDYNIWQDYYGYQGEQERRKRDRRVPEPKTGIFVGDVRLAVSRDGISRFQKVNPHQAVVERGDRGQWDSGFLVMPGAAIRDDRIYIFYTAADEVTGAVLPQGWLTSSPSYCATGLATLRLDGFTGLQSRDGLSPAAVTTVPIEVRVPEQARLAVNASRLMPFRNWIEVEVLDASTNEPLEGCGKLDCADLAQEGITIPVEWGERQTLAAVAVPRIKLRFHLYGKAKLHSFTFNS